MIKRLKIDKKREVNAGNKKAVLSLDMQIAIIIGIITFLIILFVVLSRIDWSGSTGDKACALSALERATSPSAFKSFIPLKCVSKKICITDGSGKCENYFAGEKDVDYVKVPKITSASSDKVAAQTARTIEQTYVEKIYNCWTMLGEGKLWIFPQSTFERYGWEEGGFKCVVCSRVAIDDKTFANLGDKVISLVDFNTYMRDTAVPGTGYSYLQAMTDKGISGFPDVNKANYEKSVVEVDKDKSTLPISADNTGTQKAIIFAQLKITSPKEALGNIGGDAAAIAGGAFVVSRLPIIRSVVGWAIRAASTKVLVIGGVIVAGVAVVTGTATYIAAYANANAAAGYCGKATSVGEDRNQFFESGCSIVQTLPYSSESINAVCADTEGKL